jgi:hypothetical protein
MKTSIEQVKVAIFYVFTNKFQLKIKKNFGGKMRKIFQIALNFLKFSRIQK